MSFCPVDHVSISPVMCPVLVTISKSRRSLRLVSNASAAAATVVGQIRTATAAIQPPELQIRAVLTFVQRPGQFATWVLALKTQIAPHSPMRLLVVRTLQVIHTFARWMDGIIR